MPVRIASAEPRSNRFEHVSRWQSLLDEGGWWHSFELPDGSQVQGANSLPSQQERLAHFQIPNDLAGRRVLDIGTWDGWFAFEMERRGASVMAVDIFDNPRFRMIHQIYQSRVDYRQVDVYDLTPARVGQFDIVLFMGVLYHLKHPLLGLERVCALTKDLAVVDSFVLQEKYAEGAALDRPLMEFFEKDEFGDQVDNWVAPNIPCLLAFCRTAGFARAELRNVGEYGASVACYRKAEPVVEANAIRPTLGYAAHHTNFGINFDSSRDEYVTCWFQFDVPEVNLNDVRAVVGPYGAVPVRLKARPDTGWWETGFKLPPGLPAGWHDVRIRVGTSALSNAKRVAIDVPLRRVRIRIRRVEDGVVWKKNRLCRDRGDVLSVWIAGLPENADVHNVHAEVRGEPLKVEYVEEVSVGKERQMNLKIPEGIPSGAHRLRVRVGDKTTEASFSIE